MPYIAMKDVPQLVREDVLREVRAIIENARPRLMQYYPISKDPTVIEVINTFTRMGTAGFEDLIWIYASASILVAFATGTLSKKRREEPAFMGPEAATLADVLELATEKFREIARVLDRKLAPWEFPTP